MNLFFRLLQTIWKGFRKPKLGILETSVLSLRVYPNDLDIYGHMNNGRYLTLMDLGRFDLILRSGMGRIAKQNHWNPLVASVSIRYKKSLKVFQSFELHTRIDSWDSQWFFIEQRFMQKGRMVAHGWVRGLFYGPAGKIQTSGILSSLGESRPSPPIPEALRTWPPAYSF